MALPAPPNIQTSWQFVGTAYLMVEGRVLDRWKVYRLPPRISSMYCWVSQSGRFKTMCGNYRGFFKDMQNIKIEFTPPGGTNGGYYNFQTEVGGWTEGWL